MKIILVLGSPNDDNGQLSEMAKSRLEICMKLYETPDCKIIPTGGFGAHFNTTSKAHAVYLKESLLAAGVKEDDILQVVESGNSVEDATLSRWIIDKLNPEEIFIVTSDYHYSRARMIFEAVYTPFTAFSFHLASSKNVDSSILDRLMSHEKTALQHLKEYGVKF